MVTYIYFVKCPNCEDEPFDFFDEAKGYAMGCLSQKPVITQTEVCRNDFGECTDSADLGTIWSWEDIVGTPDEEPAVVFSKDDIVTDYNPDNDPEFQDDDFFAISTEDSKEPMSEDFDDFVIGPQSDELIPPEFDATGETLWVAENLNGGEIVAACWTDSEDLAYRLLSQAFRERTGGDLRDCFIREAEADEPDYITDNPELLAEALTEDFDRVKAAAQCSRNCYDFYKAISSKAPAKDIKKFAKAAAKFVKDQYGLTGEAAEDLLWSGYIVWKQLHENCKKDRKPIPEGMTTLATNKRGDYLVRASSGRGYTVFNRSNVCLGGINGDNDEEAINRFQRGDLDESIRVPVPEGMTIEQLVEEMEENEDTVECTWCNDLFDKSECRKEVDLGWLCSRCEMAIKSRGETLTFKENNYWDFLEENFTDDLAKDRSGFAHVSDGLSWLRKQVDNVRDSVVKHIYGAKAYPDHYKSTATGMSPTSTYSAGDKYVYTTVALISFGGYEKSFDEAFASGKFIFENDIKKQFFKKATNDFLSDKLDSAYKSIDLAINYKKLPPFSVSVGNHTGSLYEVTFVLTVEIAVDYKPPVKHGDGSLAETLHDLGNEYDGGYPATQTWVCYVNDVDIGTVEAATEDEALEKMQQEYPEYPYGLRHEIEFWAAPADDSLFESVLTEAAGYDCPKLKEADNNKPGAAKFKILFWFERNPAAQGLHGDCPYLSGRGSDATFKNVFLQDITRASYGEVKDIELADNGEVILITTRGKKYSLRQALKIASPATDKFSNTRKVLLALKDAAETAEKTLDTKTVRNLRVRNALEKLDDTVANEFKAHIKNITFRIPAHNAYSANDLLAIDPGASEQQAELAAERINRIHDTFYSLPFAKQAEAEGMVEERIPAENVGWILSSWGAVGKIRFDCPISSLSEGAQDIIKKAKLSEDKVKTEAFEVDCYRLATELIRFFGNDPKFYEKPVESDDAFDLDFPEV